LTVCGGRKMKISDEMLIENLKAISYNIGGVPKTTDLKLGKYSINAYRRAFNTFAEALIICGMKPHIQLCLSDDDLLNDLKRVYDVIGKSFSHKEFIEHSKTVVGRNVFVRRFGSWAKALNLVGIKPIRSDLKTNNNLNIKEIINDLQNIYLDVGRTPSQKEYVSKSLIINSISDIYKTFGSWNCLLEMASIPIIKRRKLDIEELKNALNVWFNNHNCDLDCLEYWSIAKAKHSGDFPYSAGAIKNNFPGFSWEEIMRNCGFDYHTTNQFIKRGSFVGDDGETYLSLIEKRVANELFKLKGSKIKDYKYEEKVCQNREWTCDFKIILNSNKQLWLEFD
jgi:hypothetical protein